MDLYQAELIRDSIASESDTSHASAIEVLCEPDFPENTFNLIALPFSATGEGELVRDLLQQACQRLTPDGLLLTSTDNPRDTWLAERVSTHFARVRRVADERGASYLATEPRPLKKLKDFRCTFTFRDRGQTLQAVSRPGVFSHRRLDEGTRQVLKAMEICAGERVLDLGCGSGILSLAAAARAESVHAHAVDSHCRAVQCARWGAELNHFQPADSSSSRMTCELNADGKLAGRGTYDLVLANPPYYAKLDIARRFLHAARDALRPGGRLLCVTKHAETLVNSLNDFLGDGWESIEIRPAGNYQVLSAITLK